MSDRPKQQSTMDGFLRTVRQRTADIINGAAETEREARTGVSGRDVANPGRDAPGSASSAAPDFDPASPDPASSIPASSPGGSSPHGAALRAVAQETLRMIPQLVRTMPPSFNARMSWNFQKRTLPALPQLPFSTPIPIQVINSDTFDAAIDLHRRNNPAFPVAVLNLANHQKPGGGWKNGAMAQEEALCFRSSLSWSLDAATYPLRRREVIYSPNVVILRSSTSQGHRLLWGLGGPANRIAEVPASHKVSVISAAAVYQPQVANGLFADPRDRNLTKDKMALAVRTVLSQGHRDLVLGALGCGVFRNPPLDVAACWLEVLRRPEFHGRLGAVVFAVMSGRNDSNYRVFSQVLEGQLVG